MQMDGVVVTALVGHGEAIALPGFSREQRVGSRLGLAIDGPAERGVGRVRPSRFAALIGVFDNNAKPHLAVFVLDPSKYPNTRSIHIHDHIGTLRRRQKQRVDVFPGGHWIPSP